MDLTDVIASFATGTYTVTRRSASAYGSDGRLDAPTTTTFTVTAVVHPAGSLESSGRELERLSEGFQTRETLTMWTPIELKTQASSQDADRVAIDGDTWEVQRVERWNILGAYWRVFLGKVTQ